MVWLVMLVSLIGDFARADVGRSGIRNGPTVVCFIPQVMSSCESHLEAIMHAFCLLRHQTFTGSDNINLCSRKMTIDSSMTSLNDAGRALVKRTAAMRRPFL
jgi:hypothetical protein